MEERKSKHRVMNREADERYKEEKFLTAPAIFPNNDIKYEVNKTRAQIYAEETKQPIIWSIAKDKASSKVVAEKPRLDEEKKVWLTRHDRDFGDLYGVLPLIKGLPVALTDHYDRNPCKNLLRGRIGYIKSWVPDDREDSDLEGNAQYLKYPPKAVLAQYYDWVEQPDGSKVQIPCSWKLDGMSEAGVYPIRPWSRPWFLDQRRDLPVLKVTRYQLPLAPAYAITAHGSQGQTLPAAIIDLQIGRGVNPIASYVAFTRVKTRHDLLIFRSFDRAIFTQGAPEGPSLLLRHRRGEEIDWEALERKHAPKKLCKGPCNTVKLLEDFSAKERKNKENPHCLECTKRLATQGLTHRCPGCGAWRKSVDISTAAKLHRHAARELCEICTATAAATKRECGRCGEAEGQVRRAEVG